MPALTKALALEDEYSDHRSNVRIGVQLASLLPGIPSRGNRFHLGGRCREVCRYADDSGWQWSVLHESNLSRSSALPARWEGRTLIATVRSRRVSRARYTSPIPPAPNRGEDFIRAQTLTDWDSHGLPLTWNWQSITLSTKTRLNSWSFAYFLISGGRAHSHRIPWVSRELRRCGGPEAEILAFCFFRIKSPPRPNGGRR